MIDINYVIDVHDFLIEKYGGASGLRDRASLDAAINRPFATFGGEDLYPTVIHKACAIFESLVISHPFVDGNKRIAYFMLENFLSLENLEMDLSEDEAYNLPNDVAMGKYDTESLTEYVRKNTAPLKKR